LLGINGGTKELVEVVVVWIELIRLALYSQITTRKHESELLGLVLCLNGGALFILRTKSQEPRESHIVYGALVPLGCPCDGIVIGVVIIRAMELGENFFVPIIPKPHEIIKANLLALLNHGVEHGVVEVLIVLLIDVTHLHNWSHVL
jgi:hypothetical protein